MKLYDELFTAVQAGDLTKIKNLVSSNKIDFDYHDKNKNTILQIAEKNEYKEIAEFIIKTQISQLENQVQDLKNKYLFENYLITLRKLPSDKTYLNYLKELNYLRNDKSNKSSSQSTFFITPSEHAYVSARKTWTDIVSMVYTDREKHKEFYKKSTIGRLKKFGVKNPEKVYEKCIDYLINHTVLTVTFDATTLKNGLQNFQLLNMWERDNRGEKSYRILRNDTEKGIFSFLPNAIRNEFIKNKYTRPRYGALLLLDKKNAICPTLGYGSSFIVLKDIAKLNSLFFPGDTFTHYIHQDLYYMPTTVHHFSCLLQQCHETTLKSIMAMAEGKSPANNFDQNKFNEKDGGYIEVMLPAIDIFDSKLVEHIHIDLNDYVMSEEEIKYVENLGISISNSKIPPYIRLNSYFIEAIKNDDVKKVQNYLTEHPSLAKTLDENGYSAAQIAVKNGCLETLKFLNELKLTLATNFKNNQTLLKLAVQSKNLSIVCYLLELNQKNILNLDKDKIVSELNEALEFAQNLRFDHIAAKIADTYLQNYLDINKSFPDCLILYAVQKYDDNDIKKLLRAENLNINYCNKHNESAIVIASKNSDFSKVKLLLQYYSKSKMDELSVDQINLAYKASTKNGNHQIMASIEDFLRTSSNDQYMFFSKKPLVNKPVNPLTYPNKQAF